MYRKSRDFLAWRARNLFFFFLRPWVGKLQVAFRCVEWSAKDCICNNGILCLVQSAQLDVQANSYSHRGTRGRGGWDPRPLDLITHK